MSIATTRKIIAIALLLTLLLATTVIAQESTPEPVAPPTQPTEPPPPEPAFAEVVNAEGVTVGFYFEELAQGRAGLYRVFGGDIRSVQASFLNHVSETFAVEGYEGFFGLLSAGMEQTARDGYALALIITREDGTVQNIEVPVNVDTGGFIRQDVDIQPDRAYLVDPEVERFEFSRLDSIHNDLTLEKLWDAWGFDLPMDAELTSPFGAVRVFNETFPTRHTGWDFRAPVGTPVMAAAGGQVAFTGAMDIRGNHVVIDHGYGVFTGYSHLSQVHVTRGQSITRGQIIGTSGNSGRSSGAHFHWEAVVNGEWVDAVLLSQLWLP